MLFSLQGDNETLDEVKAMTYNQTAEQSRAEQSRAEQSRAEQSRAEQSRAAKQAVDFRLFSHTPIRPG
ncbi:adenine methyltransferase [Lactococcus muris]|uniref:adenine methyltransferase n=1 Tax=Lactococcus muris TaxID=2941330 RepID=UPI00373FCB4E